MTGTGFDMLMLGSAIPGEDSTVQLNHIPSLLQYMDFNKLLQVTNAIKQITDLYKFIFILP